METRCAGIVENTLTRINEIVVQVVVARGKYLV